MRGIFVPPGETNATFYDVNQIMHTIWAGAKYDVWTNLSVATSFTYQRQNDFLPTPAICTGSGINISACARLYRLVGVLAGRRRGPRLFVSASPPAATCGSNRMVLVFHCS